MKKTLILLILSISTAKTLAQNTYVPDDNFESALIELGYDSGELDNYVPTANINQITSLSVANRLISDMTGIEDFVSLQNLNCSRNYGITELNVTTLPDLERLSCSENQLTELNLLSNSKLTHLATFITNIESLNLFNNIHLISLNCEVCQLTELDVSRCEDLIYLNCQSNQLTTLLLQLNPKLEFLYCGGNLLTDLSIVNNSKLIILDCRGNELNHLELENLNFLKYLNCNNCNLSNINTSIFPRLEQLYVGRNNLSHLSVTQNTNLKKLSIEKNDLVILDLSNNVNLNYLYAVDNNLKYVDLRNGNNQNLSANNLYLNDNDSLQCVLVDDSYYSNSNWVNSAVQISFSEECDYLSTPEHIAFEISVYPNPVVNYMNITAPTESNYNLVNINGQTIQQGNLTSGQNSIDVSALPTGIYLINIYNDNATITKQISKL
jgi:Leucine-rich repeat (LRR) protein